MAAQKVAITDIVARAVQEPVGRRVFLLLTLRTDANVSGVGETDAGSDPRGAVARLLALRPILVGEDATAAEVVRKKILTAAPGSTNEAAAVNMALLDIMGKQAKAPTHEVLGGPTRNKIRALACLEPLKDSELKASVQQARQAGFRAFVIPLRLPDTPARGRAFHRQTLQNLESLREAAGADTDFVLDCGGRVAPADAAVLARNFERFHLLWLDEPVGATDHSTLTKIAGESVTPVGFGRRLADHGAFLDLLRLEAIDVLRPDICRLGITPIKKAAALAETYYVAVAPYHRCGPIATAAALNLAAAIPNFFIQEVVFPTNERDQQMRRELTEEATEAVRDGFFPLPTGPGLGVTLNESAVKKYQFK
jgi:galactonate dehydratase